MQGLGYLISTASVILLGMVAWPRPDEPSWKAAVTVAGMVAAILGMALRYISHRKQKAQLDAAVPDDAAP